GPFRSSRIDSALPVRRSICPTGVEARRVFRMVRRWIEQPRLRCCQRSWADLGAGGSRQFEPLVFRGHFAVLHSKRLRMAGIAGRRERNRDSACDQRGSDRKAGGARSVADEGLVQAGKTKQKDSLRNLAP